MTGRRIALVILIILITVAGCTSVAIYKVWQWNKDIAYESCLSSLTDRIWDQSESKAIAESSVGWNILSDDEVDLVTKDIKGGHCSPSDDPRFDVRGNRIKVALRKQQPNVWPPIIIWSNGPDGIEGTDDDVVMPFGQKVPK